MTTETPSRPPLNSGLERKIQRSKLALFFEDLWPRLWLLIALAGLFVLISLLGLWPLLGETWHKAILGLFAAATVVALIYACRARWPSREAAMRRLERDSGVAHRPASSYEDTLAGDGHDPATTALWGAHQAWLTGLLERLRVRNPRPRVYRRDPFALRMLLGLVVLLFAVLAGDGAYDRLRAAFRFDEPATSATARLDAWVTPPAYTAKAPMMLADGSRTNDPLASKGAGGGPLEIPEKSVLFVRSSGAPGAKLVLVAVGGAEPLRQIEAKPVGSTGDVFEIKFEIPSSLKTSVLVSGSERAVWNFAVIPDLPPKITLTKEPEQTPRGAMKLTYKVEDDYGVAGAEAKFAKRRSEKEDPATAWARTPGFRGPRFPPDRPPRMVLRLPRAGAKGAEAHTYLEMGSHPWAGIEVALTLEAKDQAGKIGRSATKTIVLPARRFDKPLARAIVEQRRKLVEDSRARDQVLTALGALTLEPYGFIEDTRAYLGLRSVYHRLRQDHSRAGWKSAVEQLWHVALRIEDGDLSDAERTLREAQEKLSKALEDGASDEEIKQLMAELRQALDQYMRQMADQAEKMPEGIDPKSQMLSQQDLERMMSNIEEMAKNGSRDQAQQMLSELRDMMERMQSGRMTEQQAQKTKEMMRMMNELGGLVGEQQKLMDDTFAEQRKLEGQGDERQGQKGAQKGQSGQGKGAQGKGQRQASKQQGPGEPGQQPGPGELGQRQAELRERLRELQREMGKSGQPSPEQLDAAREAMEGAERSLEEGDLGSATEQQAKALDEMRQGAQSMAQEMLENSPQRFGQGGDTPRDPLGRPQRSQGPDLGTSVKVPDEIDIQRAREILEELRKRLGEPQRPAGEIDYIERLLRRF